MSKSYKKYPRVKCERTCKWGKKQANKAVRRYKGYISNGCEYQKIFNSYTICDYTFTQFKEWEIESWYKRQAELLNGIKRRRSPVDDWTLEEALSQWKRWYVNK